MATNIATSPILVTWEDALRTFKKTLPSKDLKEIQTPTKPEELISYLKVWKLYQQGKSAKAISAVQSGVSRVQRFSACLDVLSQGLPDPAALLWGSIRFVLKIVQDYAEEYDKICEAFAAMVESLPRVEIYANTFPGSTLLHSSIHDVFVSSLHFWMKACKFYRRHRFLNFLRTAWNDYDVEFSRLENAMKNAVDRVERGGIVEHIKEAKAFRVEQQLISERTSELKQSEALATLIRSLSPSTGDIDYYVHDHESAQKLRHPGTCAWLLEHDTFFQWSKASLAAAQSSLLLWINAGPGMGKTVLSAAIIDHLTSSSASNEIPILIYFYFKGFSLDKNNPSAAVLSFLYQILVRNKNNPMIVSRVSETFNGANGASKPGFDSLWSLFCGVLEELSTVTLVLDGLDECSDLKDFVKKLRDLPNNGRTRVLITSRREKHFVKEFGNCQSLEITSEHVQKDIKAFVEYKVARSTLLSNSILTGLIEEKLLNSNFGMFLWVRLVLKELKTCLSVEQVQQTLAQLPAGLEAIYSAAVQRLEKTLTRSAVGVARKVLAWAIGSARSISFDELCTALSYQYKLEGQTLLYEDSTFPYSEKDIELMCGALIIIRNGQVQPAHYTVKGYMLELGKEVKTRSVSNITLIPDLRATSLDLAAVCVTYFAEKSSLLPAKRDLLQPEKSNDIFDNDAFLSYSCIYWSYHVLDCPIEWGNDVARWLSKQFTSPVVTRYWLEGSLLLDRRGLWRIVICIEELEVFFCERWGMEDASEEVSQACEWCKGIRNLLDDYGAIIMESPSLIQTLDLESFYFGKPSKSFSESRSENEQEVEVILHKLRTPIVSDPNVESTYLGYEGFEHFNLWKAKLGFFVYDPNQDVFFSGEKSLDMVRSYQRSEVRQEWLFVQQAKTGRRLPPVAKDLEENISSRTYPRTHVIAAKVSPDGRFFVIAYSGWLSVWVIERNLAFQQSRKATQRLTSHNWAFRLMVYPYPDSTIFTESDTDASIIAISPENRLFVPGGWFNLPSRKFCTFGLEESNSQASPMLFSGNGAYLFRVHRSALSQQIFQYQTDHALRYPPVCTFNVKPQWEIKPSNTGSHLVLFSPDIEVVRADISLVECNSSRLFDISEGKVHFGHRSFYFSKDDGQVVTFLRGPPFRGGLHAEVTVSVWKLGPEGPKKCSTGSIPIAVKSCSSWNMNPPLFAMRSDNFAWIVTCDRSIYFAQFDFLSVSFPGRKVVEISEVWLLDRGRRPRTIAFERWHNEVHQDGNSVANVYVRDSEVRFRVLSISGNRAGEVLTDKVCRLLNAYEPWATVPVALNRHFDTLVVGAYAFIIGLHNSPSIKLDIDIDRIKKSWHDAEWECKISCCGCFVAFVRPGGRDLGELAMFRIDRSTLESSRLDILPAREAALKDLDLEVRSVEFHQSLPIATVLYNLPERYERVWDNRNLRVSDLVTCTIHFDKSIILENPPFQRIWNSEWGSGLDENNDTDLRRRRDSMIGAISPVFLEPQTLLRSSAGFSEGGSSIYLPCSEFRDNPTGRLLLSDISLSPRPLKIIESRSVVNASKSTSYILRADKGLVWVEMHEYKTLPDDVKLPFFQKTKRVATTKYITAYPEIWNSYYLDACLLLGENYDEHVRFCIHSRKEFVPVLKKLTVSWNDILRTLEKELAVKD